MSKHELVIVFFLNISFNFQVFARSINKDNIRNLRIVHNTMATSNEAQDVVWCKYCLQYAAEYYCGDCRDKMCQTCKNSHKGHPHLLLLRTMNGKRL